MSVQIKGVGTIGGIDQGLNTVGVITATSLVGTGVSVVGVITATSFVGSGANLTGITQTTINTSADNRVLTGTGSANTIQGESGLLFDGQELQITNAQPKLKLIDTGVSNVEARVDGDGGNLIIAADHNNAVSNTNISFTIDQSEKLRIDSSGHLSVNTTTKGLATYGEDLTIASSDHAGITLRTGTGHKGTIYFSDGTSGAAEYKGSVQYDHSDDSLRFASAGSARFIITSAGVFHAYDGSGSSFMKQHSVGIGTTNTAGRNAGVSTARGEIVFNTSTNNIEYYVSNTIGWATVKKQANDGSSQALAARSAKALLDDGIATSGVYFLNMHGAYSSGNAKRHYCLQDTSYDGGGWTMLWCMNHGNNFASGSNYSYALNVGSPTSVSDFTAGNWGYDRRNTFTPAANDQFLIRRSDNNDWRRFVVTTWSPTANSISDGWSCTQSTEGTNRGHPYYALGQMYDTGGSAVSGMTHFNGCALGGNCNTGGGDSDGFGDHVNWSSGYSPYNCWGGAFNGQGNGGSPLYWGQSALSQGGSLYLQMFYRRAGTQ